MNFGQITQMTRPGAYCVTVGWDYLEQHIKKQSEEDTAPLDLEPDFQRAHVWNQAKQAKYVEFILRGGGSGKDLFFNCAGWMRDWRGPYVIVDGKQRLEAVRSFLRNELPLSLPELRDRPVFRHDFEDRPRLTQCYFNWHVNHLSTRAAVLKWYLEMNAGGVVHTAAELARVKALLDKETTK